ncbi:fusion gene containing ompA-signal peptide/RNase T1 [Hypoxylon rubiginosum]|uniref:Fusion gene containing ompA-signal peptide/RNase T1 n=1 Tax=Hypoxylon rubiginosum TaxID=110542 RepID=A0ACC0DIM1_9PEZI|nr:fusion gene containing ompA-signal peptide/RNase T1 [Hypoxylon rubiginosum]
MFGSKILPAILLSALSVSALAVEKIAPREDCVATCGSVCYWQSDIDAAVQKGYSLYKSGQTLGSDDYPHQYNDYEGFDFPDPAPWYEFPILSSFDVYSGGSPGADRVVFNSGGNYQASITHTGASGNDFVACT